MQLFHRFINEVARNAQSLYILGDFFEVWVGDDNLAEAFNQDIANILNSLSARGVDVFFLPGNRDFLVGPDFAKAAGLTLLPDPTPIDLYGIATLLAHGDQFCTDDDSYQAFRRQVRDPAWQQQFLAQPLPQRLALAAALRERSEHAKADKNPEIMDVNADAINAAVATYPVSRIIHGHTHRPARHKTTLNGKTLERWVLPDWYETGGYLACDERGCRLLSFA